MTARTEAQQAIAGVLRDADSNDLDEIARQCALVLEGRGLIGETTTATAAAAAKRKTKTAAPIVYCTVHPSVKMPCLMPHQAMHLQQDT